MFVKSVSGLAAEGATLGVKTEDDRGNNEEYLTQNIPVPLFLLFVTEVDAQSLDIPQDLCPGKAAFCGSQ